MMITDAQLAALRDAADVWQAAPIGSEEEFDAAGDMYAAIQVVLSGSRERMAA